MPAAARQQHAPWAALPAELLEQIFRQLLLSADADSCGWAARDALRLLAGASTCRHWRGAALQMLRSASLRCNMDRGEVRCVTELAASGAHPRSLWIEWKPPFAGMSPRRWGEPAHPLAYRGFWQQVAPHLQLLGCVQAGSSGWPWGLLGGACASLRALHLHVFQGIWQVEVGGPAWSSLRALTELAVTAGPRKVVSVEAPLPPALRQLTVSVDRIYCDMPLLLALPRAQLAAQELYCVADTPENNATSEAFVLDLADLAEAVAAAHAERTAAAASTAATAGAVAAGAAAGHFVEICTQAIWYRQHPGGQPAWLHALFASDQMPDELPPLQPGQQQQGVAPQPAPAPPTPARSMRPRVLPHSQQQRDEALPPLLRQPPAEVLAAFAASEPRGGRELVATAGGVTLRMTRARPTWPLEPYGDHQLAAMRLRLHS